MNNKQIYLSNGQLADLISEIDGKFLVAPHMWFEPYINGYGDIEQDAYPEASDSLLLVDKVFKQSPINIIDEKYKLAKDSLNILEQKNKDIQEEHRRLTVEVNNLKNQKTDLEKMIINRKEFESVKTLWAFPSNRLLPKEYTADGYDGFKFSFYFESRKGIKSEWVTKLEYDRINLNSDHIDSKFGLLINKTKEEIDAITKERIAYHPISYWSQYRNEISELNSVDNSFLTPNLIEIKNNQIENQKQKDKEKTERELKELQEKLDKLKSKSNGKN